MPDHSGGRKETNEDPPINNNAIKTIQKRILLPNDFNIAEKIVRITDNNPPTFHVISQLIFAKCAYYLS